jgi:hypothetical protein
MQLLKHFDLLGQRTLLGIAEEQLMKLFWAIDIVFGDQAN